MAQVLLKGGVRPYFELVEVRLRLVIESETGDRVEVEPAKFVHNMANDGQVLNAFDTKVNEMRDQLVLFLARREARAEVKARSSVAKN